jgi:hypothetical protein
VELKQLLTRDPNTLPYRIVEAWTGRAVAVQFAPLTPDDEAELRGPEWRSARFAVVWPEYVRLAGTLKLICRRGRDRRIQGLVYPGRVPWPGSPLEKNLLEAAPFNQYTAGEQRVYRGVGRVLVARLVAESFRQGGHGCVLVQAAPGSEGFYETLGFQRVTRLGRQFLLDEDAAEQLLATFFRVSWWDRWKITWRRWWRET